MSKQLGCRPSEHYGITDELAAWSFDRAVALFGVSLEADIHKATKDTKPDNYDRVANGVIKAWMNPDRKKNGGQFKDPAKHMTF